MSTASILALVVVLNGAATYTQQTVALLPESECLASMHALWSVPADTVADSEAPTFDAYCVDPLEVQPVGVLQSGSVYLP